MRLTPDFPRNIGKSWKSWVQIHDLSLIFLEILSNLFEAQSKLFDFHDLKFLGKSGVYLIPPSSAQAYVET